MPTDNAAAWDRHSAAYQAGAQLPTDVAHYGPDIGTESDYRLLGDLKGKRVSRAGMRRRAVLDRLRQAGRHRDRRRLLEPSSSPSPVACATART